MSDLKCRSDAAACGPRVGRVWAACGPRVGRVWAAGGPPVYYLEHEWGGGAREVETLQQLSLHVVFAAVALDHHRLRRTLERKPDIIRAGKSTQFM